MRMFLFTLLLALSPFTLAQAQDSLPDGQNRFVFGMAQYNPLGQQQEDHRISGKLEYRMGAIPIWYFHPWVGFEHMGRGAFWAGAGLETDIDLSDHWVLTLQTGPGYLDDGNEHTIINIYPNAGLMFRSQMEIGYKIMGPDGPDARIGLNIGHISNAKLGGDSNPGVETVGVYVHVPIDIFSKE